MGATEQYHIMLDGQGYLIDPASYRRRPAARFAPKTRTGEEGYGDFVNGSAWSQSSWAEGFGFEEWDKAHNTQLADNNGVDTSRGDMRPGRPVSIPPGTGIWQFALFQGALYGIEGNSTNVYRYDAGSVTLVVALGSISACSSLRAIGVSRHGAPQPSLFVGSGSNGKVFRMDPYGVWTLFTEFPGASGIHALTDAFRVTTSAPSPPIESQLMIGVSQVADGGGTTVYSPGSSGLGTADYTGAFPGILVFSPYPHIEAIYGLRSQTEGIYFGTGDLSIGSGELWRIQNIGMSSQVATRVALLTDNVPTCFIEYANELLAGTFTRGRIYKIEPNKIEEFFHIPEIARPGAPPMYTQRINQMVVADDRLYVPFLDVQGLCAYQFDGTGWGRINTAWYGNTAPRGIGALQSTLYVAGDVNLLRLPPEYSTDGAEATTPWFDADLGTLDKGLMRVTLAHSVLRTGERIEVSFAVDDVAAFTALGIANVVGASTSTFTFPSGTHGKRVRLHFLFRLTDWTHGVRLRSFIVEYNLTGDVVAGNPAGEPPTADHVKGEFAFDVLLEGTFEHPLVRLDRSVEPKTGDQLRRALWASKAKQAAVTYEDVDGQQYSLWFSDLEDRLSKEHATPEQGWRGTVRLTEE